MKYIRSFLITIFALIVGMGTSVLVMTRGWGMEPKSWWWILGGSFIGHILAQVFFEIAKAKDE